MLDDVSLVSADMIARAKAVPVVEIAASRIDLTRRGGRYWARCPFHADNSPSFVVDQRFHCFGCAADGDAIDFLMRMERLTFKEACERLTSQEPAATPRKRAPLDGSHYEGIVAIGQPENQILVGNKTPPIFNPRQADNPKKRFVHYTPKAVYPYRDGTGKLLGYVLRVEIGDRKLTPLIQYARLTDGQEAWCHLPFRQPRPLYHLDQLAANPTAPVVVVEGEKCAGAAPRLLPGHVGVTWQGGALVPDRADWSALRGRHVLLWPDADRHRVKDQRQAERVGAAIGDVIPMKAQPGIRAMAIAGRCLKRYAATIDYIRVGIDPARKDGWDCADAVAEDWTPRQAAGWIEARKVRVFPRADQ